MSQTTLQKRCPIVRTTDGNALRSRRPNIKGAFVDADRPAFLIWRAVGDGDHGPSTVRRYNDHRIGDAAGFCPFDAALKSRIEIAPNNCRDRVLAKQLWVQGHAF